MSPTSLISSTSFDHDEPDWKPLEDLLGVDLVGAFMWMFELDLADGTSVHAYKHIATRAYIYSPLMDAPLVACGAITTARFLCTWP